MPKTALKASLPTTRLHLPACFNRHAMDQSFLAHLCVHLDVLLHTDCQPNSVSLNKNGKGEKGEIRR